jgi:hypothetical protein
MIGLFSGPARLVQVRTHKRAVLNRLFTIFDAYFGQGKTMPNQQMHEVKAVASTHQEAASPTRHSLEATAGNGASHILRNPAPDASPPSVPSPSRTFTAFSC